MNYKPFIFLALFLLIITAGCISTQRFSIRESSSSDAGITEKLAPSPERGAMDYGGKTIPLDRKIISTAHLQMEVGNVGKTFQEITNITLMHGGFISSSSIYNTGVRNNGQMTVRVPQKNFYSAIEQIELLGTVKSRQISGQDVTEEYIDLNARLDNLKKQEIRLQEILKMATTVKDVLEVEHELERVRGEIERLTGRLNYLNQSVEMSTITVNAAEPAPITGEGWGITDALREALRGFIESIKGIIIFTGYILPVLIFIVLITVITLRIKRKVWPRFKP